MTNIGEAVYNDNVNIIDERYGNGILMSPSLIVYVIHFYLAIWQALEFETF